jgi:hypothetical protein
MHRAPAASFTVQRSRWHLRVIFILWGVSGGALLLLCLHQPDLVALAAAFALWLALGAFAFRAWQKSPMGRLQWDGEVWHWVSGDTVFECHPAWVFDFQRLMLLVVRLTPRGQIYVWLERPSPSDLSWHALRRAIVTSQRKPTPRGTAASSQVEEHGL